jgi:hypothetical protein
MYEEFKATLFEQFGDPNAKETARRKLEKLQQGKQTFSAYWNECSLLEYEAEFDDATLYIILLRNCSERLREAW